MVTLILLTWLQVAPAQPAPKPAPPRATPTATSTTLNVTVTDSVGAVLEGVLVTVLGTPERSGKTTEEGRLRLLSMRAGTYRVRFERDGFYTFEKEISWRAGQQPPEVVVTLNTAPPPPPPPEPPPPAPAPKVEPTLPPPSAPKSMSLTDYLERNFISAREPQKVDEIGCSGVGQASVWQIREPWSDREHADADAMLYVVGGEGTVRLDGRDVALVAGSFAVVPRGSSYGFTRRGRNPLIVLAVLAGAPCPMR